MTSFKLSNDAKVRLKTMVDTSDGFKIAEVDLKLRGPGNLMGKQQSGVLNLKIADLITDADLLRLCRKVAIALLTEDPTLGSSNNTAIKKAYLEISKTSTIWSNIS